MYHRWLDTSGIKHDVVQLSEKFYPLDVFCLIDVVSPSIAPIDDKVHKTAASKKLVWVKSLKQKRKYVLRSYALKSFRRTIMVDESVVQTLELSVPFFPVIEHRPKSVDYRGRLSPTHMTIPAHHVVCYEYSTVRKMSVNIVKYMFELNDVMQRMVCHDHIIAFVR